MVLDRQNISQQDQLPPEVQDLVDEMKLAKLAKIKEIGKYVAKKRDEAVKGRKESGIETIWEEDEEYYQGIDDSNRDAHPWVKSASTQGGISRTPEKKPTRCSSFFNITRQFVESASARMGDILLPAGDWNFKIKPTPVQDDPVNFPVPQVQQVQQQADPQTGQPVQAPPPDPDAPSPAQQEAERRAEKGELWIQDKLVECNYHTEVRKAIEDAAKLGTGILKGPSPLNVTTRKATQEGGKFALQIIESTEPATKCVDCWDFFPDAACGDNIHNGRYTVERDRMTARQLSKLKGTPGYLSDQIDQVLDEGPSKKNYSDGNKQSGFSTADDDKFEVWYYTGLIDVSALGAMGTKLTEKESQKDMLPAVVTLVNDTAIKADINPLDSGEFPYDVMPWQRMAGFWAGIGIARQGRTAQDMLNSAGRALMDNAGLASGPMIIIRQGAIVPADGEWKITARKVWYATEQADVRSVADAFTTIDIPMVQPELNAIIELANKMMEDATGIVYLLQGQQGSAPDTVGGMELLHRNASAILRRIARVFDERVTEPHIKRYYEWLLLHGPDDCKGDMKIEAIGSTALVEREIQAMEAMQLLQLSLNPAFGLDPEKAMSEVLKTKRFIPDKFQMDAQKKKSLPPPIIPEIEVQKMKSADLDKTLALEKDNSIASNTLQKHKIDVDQNREDIYANTMSQEVQTNATMRQQELAIKRELAILDYANKRNISLDQVKAELAKEAMRLRTQKQLAVVAHIAENRQEPIETPPVQLPGRAPNGHAFDQI